MTADGKRKLRQYGSGRDREYRTVWLTSNGKRKGHLVHRLVAETFIDNPDGLQQVNHKDGNPSNNNASNLEWCSAHENIRHSYDNLRVQQKCALCENSIFSKHKICAKCKQMIMEKIDSEISKGVRGIDVINLEIPKVGTAARIAAMRSQGMTMQEIALEIGCSKQNVSATINRYIK